MNRTGSGKSHDEQIAAYEQELDRWERETGEHRDSYPLDRDDVECGWTGKSGFFVCVKPKYHTGNHRTIRREDTRCLQIGCLNERDSRDGSGFCTKHIMMRGWKPGGKR